MSHYTMLSKCGNLTRLLKIKNKLKIGCFLQIKSGRILCYLTIIPLAIVGYEMITANSYPTRTPGIINNYSFQSRWIVAKCSYFKLSCSKFYWLELPFSISPGQIDLNCLQDTYTFVAVYYSSKYDITHTKFPFLLETLENIQLFRERLSDKVHATTPKGIVGGFEFTVFQRNLIEWQERPWTYVCEC